jgi:membrane-associated phospholipid phosphatase
MTTMTCARAMLAALLFFASLNLHAANVKATGRAVGNEIKRYTRDAKSLAAAPLHWNAARWRKAALVTAGLAATMLLDDEIREVVQENRSEFTEDLSDVITPWGGRRAEYLSLALILGGAATGNQELRDTGRDALEANILAGRVVTPLIKGVAGRSRPFMNEGTYEFEPLSGNTSFPSGHATNAFAIASVVAEHSQRRSVRVLAYGLAGAVAYARVHDDVHFASDVYAGTVIGTAIGRGIVARHRNDQTQRVIMEPLWIEDGFGVTVRWSWR